MNQYEPTFFLAIQLQDHETIERLIDKVDVNSRNGNALSVSAYNGDYETVKMLLAAGANADADKSRALLQAASMGHTMLIDLLLNYGAKNIDGAIKVAAKKKQQGPLWHLLNHTRADSEYSLITTNGLLMETINEALNCVDIEYKETLMAMIFNGEVHAIEELTRTDILERLRNLEPNKIKKQALTMKMKW